MLSIKSFTFNPIQENMYVLYDDTKECIIIDPGCYFDHEETELVDFIATNHLTLKKLVNTHCHLDHICGNAFVANQWNLVLEASLMDEYNLELSIKAGIMYNMPIKPSPPITVALAENDKILFGTTQLDIIHTPGHSSGSLSFYNEEHKILIAGDVLFYESIGRTDLPGGDYATLIHAITKKLGHLPDDTKVYSGHGMATSLGHERKHNPFLVEN
jgi:hydroxyacylglutathione hydrolase